jgi:hypothetical protein
VAYTDQAALAVDVTFRSRVRVALATAAVQVMGEDAAGYSDSEYGKRQALAYEVLRSAAGGMWLETFVWATVQNAAITGASLDSDIQFQVNAAWGDIAGVRITD